MSLYELSFKILPSGSIFAFCASKHTEDKYSGELTMDTITGFPSRIKTLEQAYKMLNKMMDDNDFILTFKTFTDDNTSEKNTFGNIVKTDDCTDSGSESGSESGFGTESETTDRDHFPQTGDVVEKNNDVSNAKKGKILCTFSHEMYGFEIFFELDKIQEGIIIYDIKSEKRLRQLEQQLKGVFFLKKCNKPIRFDATELSLSFTTFLLMEKMKSINIYHKNTPVNGINVSWIDTFCHTMAVYIDLETEHDEYLMFKGEDISPLSLLTSIKVLKIIDNPLIKSIDHLGELKTLEELSLSGCTKISNLSSISHLPNLKKLDLSKCTGIVDVRPLKNVTSLVELNLTGTNVKNVLALKQLPNLSIKGI